MTDEHTRFFRFTIPPSADPREVTIYHDGQHEVWVDGVQFYAPPPESRIERGYGIFGPGRRRSGRRVFHRRRSPIEWARDRWFYFRNGIPRGFQ